MNHSRLLYMYQESRIESCRDRIQKMKNSMTSSIPDTSTTHIITEIICGIHLLVIIQLPPEHEADMDIALLKMQHCLSSNDPTVKFDSDDRELFKQMISVEVYSNISDLSKIKKLEVLYQRIKELQTNEEEQLPLKYILTPIDWFNGQHTGCTSKFASCEPNEIESTERYLVQQLSAIKRLKLRLDDYLPELLPEGLEEQAKDVQKEFSKIKELHEEKLKQISGWLLNTRQGESSRNPIDSHSQTEIEQLVEELNQTLDELKSKCRFIQKLQNDRLEYCDVSKLGIKQGLEEQRVIDMLFGNDSHKAIFFSNDGFRNNNQKDWAKLYSEMIEERQKDDRVSLVYADFTYSTYKLKKMVTTLSSDMIVNDDRSSSQPSKNSAKRKTPSPPPSTTDEYINILLLGESGVGKSTFINAFANYLRFESLDEAQRGKPVVIIPVTFLMTINDNFDEKVIKFGDVDPNENHNNFGQSVTQQCKSYVFNISDKKKLRIIDTPGFGDTRGNNQDNLNMEQVFSFLNNLNYLNGICLLFKPEVAHLNPYFRSCCNQLFDYFAKNIRDHFIFCFTNARSTFFAPGSTRPLLTAFFDSLPGNKVRFEKRNTFCFDSESFRYLVAIQNSIPFGSSERGEFEQSWLRSVAESERFRDFLCHQPTYNKNDEWQSNKDALFQINYMIRPMLEGMRNLLRNIRLYNFDSSIQLRATHLEQPKILCYTCSHTLEEYGQFWILRHRLHSLPNKCDSNEQKPTEYRLRYDLLSKHDNESFAGLKKQLKSLYEICATFSYFSMKTSQSPQDDAFLTGINRMINEEKSNCEAHKSDNLNETLIEGMGQFRTKYERQLEAIKSQSDNIDLSNIYYLIKLVNEIPMIEVQLVAIRKYHQHLLESNEHIIHVNESHQN